ncbi:dihydrolipoamide acetyltransferase family protein [Ammoniphilus sp. YIM 78166]|uniref:dihydrolipoamide acetyltransferase family protein n=1 Tax=Ammoniphilus sp. YIM 78166 TaxID=1644106 RepID=UPI00106F7CE9|nr:dihydrolipoamide acetyltransferase family protein [Ammoniphilus sp. YIM 78166]
MVITLPKLGANMDSAVITKWLKSEGDPVDKNEAIAEVSTDKVNVELEAPEAGFLVKQYFQEDDDVPVGAIVAEIGPPAEKSNEGIAKESVKGQKGDARRILASPSARKLAMKLGLDLAEVKGSGPNGRIVRKDILDSTNAETSEKEEKKHDPVRLDENNHKPIPHERDDHPKEAVEICSLNRIERISGERMLQSLQSTAQLTLTRDVDVTDALAMLESVKKAKGLRITFTSMILLAVAKALKVHRRFNGKLENGEIRIPSGIHLNVAVATDNGLLVPLIKDLQYKSLIEVSRDLNHIVDKARDGKLDSDDLGIGNFTLTNLGASGVDTFTPILNPGQIGILGAGRILQRPWVYDGKLDVRSILSLSLTWDHQAVDGYPAAQFMKSIAENLETPSLML